MQLTDFRIIRADAATVWAALLNPEVLKDAVPGCESMTGSPETGFEAVVKQKVGPVSARFTGVVSLADIIAPHSLTISGEGKGGPAGYAKGGAKVTLEPVPEGTKLSYEVEASVGGKIAQLGSRLIDSFAKKMADDFFARFQAAVEGPDAAPSDAAAGAEQAAPAPAPDGAPADATTQAPKKGWLRRIFG